MRTPRPNRVRSTRTASIAVYGSTIFCAYEIRQKAGYNVNRTNGIDQFFSPMRAPQISL
jgi:hypothetical protein